MFLNRFNWIRWSILLLSLDVFPVWDDNEDWVPSYNSKDEMNQSWYSGLHIDMRKVSSMIS